MDKINKAAGRTEICLNCRYFDRFPIQKREDNVLGACKANPPTPAPDYNDNKLGIWPLVLGTFFCGIWESKIK